jgi:pimeloyl-ACP methyl ester carboxylesterase
MTSYATSTDGTRIAFDRFGDGPPVVIVSGMFCDRQRTDDLAQHLAKRCTVINYDRRGRGDSGDTSPYAVAREVEDLAALIAHAAGAAAVYGHSSGAGLAVHAAASGLPITRLVLHEPPYGSDDEDSKREARRLAETVAEALAEGRRADAIRAFLAEYGMSDDMVEAASRDAMMQAVAPTMLYDFEAMGDLDGGTIPEDLLRRITVPTLVLAGSTSPEFFRTAATRVAELLPNATYSILDGGDHAAAAELVAPVVGDFVAGSPSGCTSVPG